MCIRDSDVNAPASIFSKKVNPVWPDLLFCYDITGYIVDIKAKTTKSLPALYEDDPGESDDEADEWEDGIHEDDEDEGTDNDNDAGDYEDESDEDMPDLEPHEYPTLAIDDMD